MILLALVCGALNDSTACLSADIESKRKTTNASDSLLGHASMHMVFFERQ